MTPNLNTNRLTLKYFAFKALKYKWLLLLFFIAVAIAVIGQEFVTILLYKEIFDLMALNQENPALIYPELIKLVLFIALTHVMSTLLWWRVASFANDHFQPFVMRDIEDEVFAKLQNHSHSFYTNHFTGGLVSKANRFVRSFEMIADIIQWHLFKIIILFLGSVMVIYYFLPLLAFTLIAWTTVYTIISFVYSRWALKFWRQNASDDSHVTAELADSLSNILNVKIFTGTKVEQSRFNHTINKRRKSRSKAWMTGSLMGVWQGIMMVGFEVFLIYQMVLAWTDGAITLGTIFAIQTFIWLVFSNLWELGRLFQDYSNALADAEEMTLILNQVPSIQDPKTPAACRIKHGSIEFKNVGFKYETTDQTPTIFKNFSLKIKAGEKIGLVGESGAGKSTFVNLLIRFMDTNEGEILIDDQNIKHLMQNDLRKNLAYVPQEPILFHRTLKENIAYGCPNASDEQIIMVAKAAYAHEFITTFPEKYETLVGERGVKLSGGQKQRVAIARAMLKSAPILILDEATSSLDSKAEIFIQEALAKLMSHKTTLVIAHRLSTLREMDRIIVFDKGKIIEDGNHDDLISIPGKYAELWQHQSGGFLQ